MDRHAGEIITAQLNDDENFPRLEKILGDKAYRDVGISCRVPASIESDCRKEGEKGFVPQAFRWVVERSFAWLNRQRRLVRNYEKNSDHQESMSFIGNIRIAMRKISQLS